MSRIRTLGVAALALALAAMVSSTKAADENKKKDHGGVHGVVLKVEKATDTTGSFTIKVEEKKAKDAAATTTEAKAGDAKGEEKTFMVTADTKFVKVAHKKKDAAAADAKAEAEETPATFADLKEGEHVAVEATGDAATLVKIHGGKKAKKPAA